MSEDTKFGILVCFFIIIYCLSVFFCCYFANEKWAFNQESVETSYYWNTEPRPEYFGMKRSTDLHSLKNEAYFIGFLFGTLFLGPIVAIATTAAANYTMSFFVKK